jgi:K+/H+ antiporter YhaU regulatory subunit KhtT
VDLYIRTLPSSLHGTTLAQSGIGAQTGLSVIALKTDGRILTSLTPDQPLEAGTELVMIGTDEQLDAFVDSYG